jgi:hypothetical protein
VNSECVTAEVKREFEDDFDGLGSELGLPCVLEEIELRRSASSPVAPKRTLSKQLYLSKKGTVRE